MNQCANCGCKLPDNAKFCVQCGKPAQELSEYIFCKKCGNQLLANAVFCIYCGANIRKIQEDSGSAQKDESVNETVAAGGQQASPGQPVSEAAGVSLAPQKPEPPAHSWSNAGSVPQEASQVEVQMKKCTKCGAELGNDVLFCNGCGTKQYIWSQAPPQRIGELLMEFTTCQYIRLQLVKQPGVLSVYDDRLYFCPASGTPHTLLFYEIMGVVPASTLVGSSGIRINTKKGKSYTYGFGDPEKDSIPYLIGLLMNYKY